MLDVLDFAILITGFTQKNRIEQGINQNFLLNYLAVWLECRQLSGYFKKEDAS